MTYLMILLGILPACICFALGWKAYRVDLEPAALKAIVGLMCFLLAILATVNLFQWLPNWLKSFLMADNALTIIGYRIIFTLGFCALGGLTIYIIHKYFYSASFNVPIMQNGITVGEVRPWSECQQKTDRFREKFPDLTYMFTFDNLQFEKVLKAVGSRQTHIFLGITKEGVLDAWVSPGDGQGNLIALDLPKELASRSGDSEEEDTEGGALNHAGLTPPPKDGGKG